MARSQGNLGADQGPLDLGALSGSSRPRAGGRGCWPGGAGGADSPAADAAAGRGCWPGGDSGADSSAANAAAGRGCWPDSDDRARGDVRPAEAILRILRGLAR
ncbi:MAG TPA: hypothetical protein VMR14_25135 [Streptosporangiaceae bacterium]|nr:hypothetical protein [Streptosporangiaceae bacterium]